MTSYVVKVGGHALDSLEPDATVLVALASDVAALRDEGSDVIVVHGGGPQIEALLSSVGLVGRFHEGLRVTDEVTMEYVAMALGHVNLHLVAAFEQSGVACVGLSGADRSLLRATALGNAWGRAGGSPKVDAEIVTTLWRSGVTPVTSPLALDEAGALVNCNADAAAGALAGALGARTLVLLSDVDQLRGDAHDETTALASVNGSEVRRLLEEGRAREGMRPKMLAALEALESGAERVLVANGTRPHALRDALSGVAKTTEVVR